MIRISGRIWEYWREVQERFEAEAVNLLFSSSVPQKQAFDALRQAATEAIRELESRTSHEPGFDEMSTGAFSFAPAPDGVLVRIDEYPEDLEGLLRGVAARLEEKGIDGRFDHYEPREIVKVPERVDLLECRIRVRGERYHHRGPNHGWRADPDALAQAVDFGSHWCVANASHLPLSFKVGLLEPVVLPPEDDIGLYMRQGLEQTDVGVVQLSSVGPDRFRRLAVHPWTGRVSLIEGGSTIELHGWQAALESLKEMLVAAAPWAVYGFIKRGSHPEAAALGSSLSCNWVPILHRNALWGGGDAFEDELAPDAFGVQLLGSDYRSAPNGGEWRLASVDGGAVLVEHADADAWFGRLFGAFEGDRTVPTDPALIPDIVARAREDFDDVLFTDDIAWSHSRCATVPEP
jgi:hypothetical protein